MDDLITLAHGNGGRLTRALVEDLVAATLKHPALDTGLDAAVLPALGPDLLMTSDGFTVKPLEFPGGNIGSLAVHGTVNDLAVSGGKPRFLTMSLLLEEGLPVSVLRRVLASFADACGQCGVQVVAGDTKVVGRGEGSGIYMAVTGIGERKVRWGMDRIREGDDILVSGPVGDHGVAVMLARQEFGLSGELRSDSASVYSLTEAVHGIGGVRFMRDPTRGGLATVCHEIAQGSGVSILLEGQKIPIRDQVATVCAMLGLDPLYFACEGRVVAVVAPECTENVLAVWQNLPEGCEACVVGKIAGGSGVYTRTEFGGERFVAELENEPLPRIC